MKYNLWFKFWKSSSFTRLIVEELDNMFSILCSAKKKAAIFGRTKIAVETELDARTKMSAEEREALQELHKKMGQREKRYLLQSER